jgi:hypothetical protein
MRATYVVVSNLINCGAAGPFAAVPALVGVAILHLIADLLELRRDYAMKNPRKQPAVLPEVHALWKT